MRDLDVGTPSTGHLDTAAETLRAIAAPGRHDFHPELFDRLLSEVWSEGTVSPATVDVAVVMRDLLPTAAAAWRPWLVLALGAFVEGSAPDPAVQDAVRSAVAAGYDGYRALLSGLGPDDHATRLALLYLLAHFPPGDGLVDELTSSPLVSAQDATRVARCAGDPPDESRFPLGRCWPSPALWVLEEHERRVDREWRANLALSEEERDGIRELETTAIMAFLGAQAENAAHRESAGDPAVDPVVEPPQRVPDTSTAETTGGHDTVFCCPRCRGPLDLATRSECPGCGGRYAVDDPVVDFLPDAEPRTAGLGLLFLQDPLHVARYEFLRPNFVALMAANWTGGIDFEQERDYLRDHVRPVDGPVFDVACGSGRWTRPLADRFGAHRVVGIDISRAMVARFHAANPGMRIGRASATGLPVATASAGAVNCWNALQLFEDPWAALAEMARVLRPGGSLTLLTFRTAARPLQRHFQRRHELAFTVSSFDQDALTTGLTGLGFEVVDTWTPNNYLFLTARRLPRTASET
ncbi:class I SAM-dependent methyltransferase [Umezawaea tangerina]|uniref:Methyltransferase family protein n=1 Tax=Umezawaea tangerina TaxID=84725 RepID=A0A2T0STU9_9PSEU|nr:class I SAM-dependent methyltransferase [Umezawaea tangerina]PRY36783.1 methyltransferase family protein [Umezawaea tangerina]